MRISLEKRLEIPRWLKIVNPFVSIALSVLFFGIILKLTGTDPVRAFKEMFEGAFGSTYAFSETIVKSIPLILCSLGLALAFRMQIWNIGAEGQLFMGAAAAAYVALHAGNKPAIVVLPLMALAGSVAGGIWGLLPGIFRAYLSVNEVMTTLMMNYIAIFWVDYLVYGPWKDLASSGFPMTAKFSKSCWLPSFCDTRIHFGLVIGLVLSFVMWVLIYKTKWGYEIRVTGMNPNAAKYAGMNTAMNIMLVMFISGAFAGLAGMSEISGIHHRLQHGFSSGYGYTAVITTWLANLHPFAAIVSSVLFGALLVGGDQLQMTMGLPGSLTFILQGTILFFILGGDMLIGYRIRIQRNRPDACPTDKLETEKGN